MTATGSPFASRRPILSKTVDCVVVGGGPAGLTAAIYLARFHLAVHIIDAGRSRAATIPRTRNHAGYPDGIPGRELVRRMAAQAAEFGAVITRARANNLSKCGDGFAIHTDDGVLIARSVLLATGVVNRRPNMSDALHDEALARGLLRYCPVCDGYEVTDNTVAVIGSGDHGLREALFLRSFTQDVTLVSPSGPHSLDDGERRTAAEAGIVLLDGPATDFRIEGDKLSLSTGVGRLAFQSAYPALGSIIQSDLGQSIGAATSNEGCLLVDAHQRTTCAGVYAAGDVVVGLDQISHAMGEGGVAATTIRNDLAALRPLYRNAR